MNTQGSSSAGHSSHSNQLNPNNDAYWSSRGHEARPSDWQSVSSSGGSSYSKAEMDNRSNQLNPNSGAYKSSRGGH
jgi:hypothetical protein